jgi:acyl carrier protein
MQVERNVVRDNVMNIIADVALDEDLSSIKDEVSLRDQLDLDSMDFLDIVMELKKRHKITVPQEEYGELATLESTVNYLLPKFNQ